ncbi:hypothetical protein [Egicoccus halophilus]|uniref:Uncharacterized protein n=1 Tax=Egicoccus halophilus TaxID=1670830 RepID=A0A8J3AHY2_9ACTN|nr:hypothetical protein [Egicoccus halophilus]GGI09159.1 hypothetical protein GCM10011354_32690 [Egicoccus halophilus]
MDQRPEASPVVVGDRLILWTVRFTALGLTASWLVTLAELLGVITFLEPVPTSDSILFVAAGAWVLYWWGFRLALRVELRADDTLVWHCALRRGEIPLEDVLAVRSTLLLLSNVIRHRRGRVLVFGMQEGFPQLVTELKRRNPAVKGELPGWMLQLDRVLRGLLRLPPWRWLPGPGNVGR